MEKKTYMGNKTYEKKTYKKHLKKNMWKKTYRKFPFLVIPLKMCLLCHPSKFPFLVIFYLKWIYYVTHQTFLFW